MQVASRETTVVASVGRPGAKALALSHASRHLAGMEHRNLLRGFIRLDILDHAVEGELQGQWLIEARTGNR
jgi:hypothetical protein